MKLFKWLKWLWRGKPMVYHDGYNCGCCGKFVRSPFRLRDYESNALSDGWGLCNRCKNMSATDHFNQTAALLNKKGYTK